MPCIDCLVNYNIDKCCCESVKLIMKLWWQDIIINSVMLIICLCNADEHVLLFTMTILRNDFGCSCPWFALKPVHMHRSGLPLLGKHAVKHSLLLAADTKCIGGKLESQSFNKSSKDPIKQKAKTLTIQFCH